MKLICKLVEINSNNQFTHTLQMLHQKVNSTIANSYAISRVFMGCHYSPLICYANQIFL